MLVSTSAITSGGSTVLPIIRYFSTSNRGPAFVETTWIRVSFLTSGSAIFLNKAARATASSSGVAGTVRRMMTGEMALVAGGMALVITADAAGRFCAMAGPIVGGLPAVSRPLVKLR